MLTDLTEAARDLAISDALDEAERAGIDPAEVRGAKANAYYKHLAKALLQGQLLPSLRSFAPSLIFRPGAVLEDRLSVQSMQLVDALRDKQIVGRRELAALWTGRTPSREREKYLLDVYRAWVRRERQGEVDKLWPPLADTR